LGGRLVGALAGGGDGSLADRFGVAGMPRPWRMKALRSDGQVVPNSFAAALTLPSCSSSWKARSASPRSGRKRLGCQPTGGERRTPNLTGRRELLETMRSTCGQAAGAR
jgi:hypothetical protein